MTKIMLLAAMLTVAPQIETTENSTTITVQAPETGHYTGCWLNEYRKPEQLKENCWRFPVRVDRGTVTLVHCTEEGCDLIDFEFGDRGLLVALIAALGAGMVMNFMPCVLPVLGLKLRAFADPRKKWAYIAGVMASFISLGTLSLFLGTGLSLMGFGHYRMTLSVVCFLFGMSLLGVWHIPAFGVSGNLGPFGVGILTVALGSSCAVPFLAPAMAYCTGCSVLETYLIFGALGGGFCSPFILPIGGFIGFFRHYLSWVERLCATALLGVSTWITWTLPDSMFTGTLMVGISTLVVLSVVTRESWFSTRKIWASVILVSMTLVGLSGVYQLCRSSGPDTSVTVEIPALDEPQVTFVTAEWCINCAAMKLTLQDSRVVSRMQELGIKPNFLDYTNRDPQVREFLDASYSTDVPILRIVGITGNVTILRGVWTVGSVLDALD